MSNFETSLAVLLKHEGEGFIQDMSDTGGASHYGITEKTLSIFLQKTATVEDVKNLSRQTADEIYKKMYWEKMRLDEISDPVVATIILDQAVLSGIPTVVGIIQEMFAIGQDRIMGSETIAAINAQDWEIFSFNLLDAMTVHYWKICFENRSQIKFLTGWSNRVLDLLHYVLSQPKC